MELINFDSKVNVLRFLKPRDLITFIITFGCRSELKDWIQLVREFQKTRKEGIKEVMGKMLAPFFGLGYHLEKIPTSQPADIFTRICHRHCKGVIAVVSLRPYTTKRKMGKRQKVGADMTISVDYEIEDAHNFMITALTGDEPDDLDVELHASLERIAEVFNSIPAKIHDLMVKQMQTQVQSFWDDEDFDQNGWHKRRRLQARSNAYVTYDGI